MGVASLNTLPLLENVLPLQLLLIWRLFLFIILTQ